MSSNTANDISTLPWTGERMVPHASDSATELYHWQRYMFFKPWYEGAKVIDAASGEGYGSNYASVFAEKVTGFDISDEAVIHANRRYPQAEFKVADVCEADYSDADLVMSFETIEHVPDPEKFLQALSTCQGKIVISTPNRKTHSPGNNLEDRPLNQFHTIEWTPFEFAEVINRNFPGRQVRFLSQQARWPGLIVEGLDDEAMYCIAVIGDGELPKWPRIGISIPTYNNSGQVTEAVMNLSRFYPGATEFAIVSNGCDPEHRAGLRKLRDSMPYMCYLIEEPENRGYGAGANIGLQRLWQESWFDYFGVCNDDVLPAVACVTELALSMVELEKAGMKPGVIGPVSNAIHGQQLVDIGTYANYPGMIYRAEQYHRTHHSRATQVLQLRGLFILIHPDCLNDVGGFDPRFGLGNFEDDDHNLRTRLAGYTLWIAEGAYLYHHGSTTFKKLEINYDANIARNRDIMIDKWQLGSIEDWMSLTSAPSGTDLYIPLWAHQGVKKEFTMNLDGEDIDLIKQASDIEFAAWVITKLRNHPREFRRAVVEVLSETAKNMAA